MFDKSGLKAALVEYKKCCQIIYPDSENRIGQSLPYRL